MKNAVSLERNQKAMKRYVVLFNPYAGNGNGETQAKHLTQIFPDASLRFIRMTDIKDYSEVFSSLSEEEKIILCGGDGTLNRFINDTKDLSLPTGILYFGVGSGNDFLHDLGKKKGAVPFCIDDYIKDLPIVTVKGKSYRFLNGIGYGIDGYCCEEGDRLRAVTDKPINYTKIAIKGLLGRYHPTDAHVTVDGITKVYKKVWLAPCMNGQFYGGGMMPTPGQNRLNTDRTLSVLVMHGTGKLRSLMIFPSIFKGEHLKYTRFVEARSGHEIEVRFDRPVALQVDGETILDVSGYRVTPSVKNASSERKAAAL